MTGLMLAAVWANPIIVGLVVGLPTAVLGVLAYRRAEALDEAAARAAAISAGGAEVQRVIDGLDLIVHNLQADNQEVRQQVVDLSVRLKECYADYDELKRTAS